MRDRDLTVLVVLAFIALLALVSFVAGYDHCRNRFQKQAVENNVAEWHVIDSFGNTKFRWLTPESKSESATP